MLPKRLQRKTIYKSNWINLHIDRVEMPSGKIIEKYHQLDYPNESIGVWVMNERDEVCIIESLRYSTNQLELEIPAGSIDDGETIIEAAVREVREETGFEAENLKKIYSYNPSNGLSNELVHIVSAHVTGKAKYNFDTDEVQAVRWLTVNEVKELLLNNEIRDGISVLGASLYLSGLFI